METTEKTYRPSIEALHKVFTDMCARTGFTPDSVFEGLLDYIIGYLNPSLTPEPIEGWKFKPQHAETFAQMLDMVMEIYKKEIPRLGWYDPFGDLYMAIHSGGNGKGQFFTPPSVAQVVAQCNVAGWSEPSGQQTPFGHRIIINDCASGSGRMPLAAYVAVLHQMQAEWGYTPAPAPQPEPKPTNNQLTRKWNSARQPVQELTLTDALFPGEQPIKGTRNIGCVYQDTYSKGIKNNHRTYHNRWVAEIQIGGVHFRHRSADKTDCEAWLKAVRNGSISPRDYGADWYLVEQRRDMEKRFEEMILSAAEEAMLAAQYTADKNLKPISDYMTQRLLPHMIYYCAHVLNMGRKTALDASTQCIAIMLENIAAGKPITNFTRYGKRMLRVRKAHRDFWYYEKVPQNIRLIIDGIDYKPLEEIYKLTKLKKI